MSGIADQVTANITLSFGELGYIACPYWPEIEWLVKLEQKAGLHPRHGADKRKKLLETYCTDNGISLDQVDAARKKVADEHWYREPDGGIYIPASQFSGCLVQALATHPLKKEVAQDQLRSFVALSKLTISPPKMKADGIYERYVKNPDTNLRRLQCDEYIANFEARGTVTFVQTIVQPDSLESLIRFAGRWVGVGSARKMSRGRYDLTEFAIGKS